MSNLASLLKSSQENLEEASQIDQLTVIPETLTPSNLPRVSHHTETSRHHQQWLQDSSSAHQASPCDPPPRLPRPHCEGASPYPHRTRSRSPQAVSGSHPGPKAHLSSTHFVKPNSKPPRTSFLGAPPNHFSLTSANPAIVLPSSPDTYED